MTLRALQRGVATTWRPARRGWSEEKQQRLQGQQSDVALQWAEKRGAR